MNNVPSLRILLADPGGGAVEDALARAPIDIDVVCISNSSELRERLIHDTFDAVLATLPILKNLWRTTNWNINARRSFSVIVLLGQDDGLGDLDAFAAEFDGCYSKEQITPKVVHRILRPTADRWLRKLLLCNRRAA